MKGSRPQSMLLLRCSSEPIDAAASRSSISSPGLLIPILNTLGVPLVAFVARAIAAGSAGSIGLGLHAQTDPFPLEVDLHDSDLHALAHLHDICGIFHELIA